MSDLAERPVSRRILRRLAMLLAFGVAGVLAAPAGATEFTGDVGYWSKFAVRTSGDRVTALSGKTLSLRCTGGEYSIDPVDFKLSAPVPIENGRFRAEGTAETVYKTPVSWRLDGSITIARTVTGRVTAEAQHPIFTEKRCAGTFRVAAVIPPLRVTHPVVRTFSAAPGGNAGFDPSVEFQFRNGTVTHLTTQLSTLCPGGTVFGSRLDTTAYRLDPVQVNRGRFRVKADILDDYGVVTRVVLKGRIAGRTANGTLNASRGWDINGRLVTCSRQARWSARISATSTAPPVQAAGAFYDVTPYRYGRPRTWSYFLLVRPHSCGGGVTAARFTVAGASRVVPCGKAVRLGPLTPKRTYRVVVVALAERGGRVVEKHRLAETTIYLPGEDGDWVPVKTPFDRRSPLVIRRSRRSLDPR